MNTALIVLLVVAGCAVVGALAYYAYQREQERKAGLAAFAKQHGFTLTERDDSLRRRWGNEHPPFSEGFDRECRNIMAGTWDSRPALLFDYRYHTWETRTDSKGNTTRTKESHDLAIIAIDTGREYPRLSVSPEGFFSRTIGRLTNTDIQLEWEDFNRAFTVTCENRRFASDFLDQQMMEVLMQHQDIGWSILATDLILARPGKHDPAELEASLTTLDRILDAVPAHVQRTDWS